MAEYIKREGAVNAVMAAKWVDGSDGAMAMEIVASPPAADVAPVVHGQWVPCFDENNNWRRGFAKCSNCGREYYASVICQYEYCCRCGAKMDGGADHEAN